MKIFCEYCGNPMQDTDEKCPSCGGINSHLKRTSDGTPKTIQELKDWYAARNLPDEKITRFFIGKDIKEPKAFGIYEESPGYFVVYKNKASGERAIRYQGTDEAYAVNEIYLKLKSEILNQKSRNINSKSGASHSGKKQNSPKNAIMRVLVNSALVIGAIICILTCGFLQEAFHLFTKIKSVIIFALILIVPVVMVVILIEVLILKKPFNTTIKIKNKKINLLIIWSILALLISIPIGWKYETPHYYSYEDNIYCEYHNNYYMYIDSDYKEIPAIPVSLEENLDEYVWEYNEEDWITEFEDSSIYDEINASSSGSSGDSDSSYDWDSGSDWDSGGTDWDSDW